MCTPALSPNGGGDVCFGEKREEEDGGGEEEEGSDSGHRWDEEMHQFPTRRNHLNIAVL